jgi:hypothetical protein
VNIFLIAAHDDLQRADKRFSINRPPLAQVQGLDFSQELFNDFNSHLITHHVAIRTRDSPQLTYVTDALRAVEPTDCNGNSDSNSRNRQDDLRNDTHAVGAPVVGDRDPLCFSYVATNGHGTVPVPFFADPALEYHARGYE